MTDDTSDEATTHVILCSGCASEAGLADDAHVLDQVVNKIHDLKHAFDLQGIEIKAYFTTLNGKYLPRQPVTFASI